MKWPLIALAVPLVASAADTRQYALTPRNLPAGANSIEAVNAINSAGDGVGSATSFPEFISLPILWKGSTAMQLPNIGAAGPYASTVLNGMNNVEGICGAGYNSNNVRRGIYWYQGAPRELIPPGGASGDGRSEALAVNDAADMVGISQIGDGASDYHATFWRASTASPPIDLGTLNGGTFSEADAISASSNLVAGFGNNAAGYYRAILWQGGKALELGTLGGPGSGAVGVNDAGQVAGNADTAKFESGNGVTHYYQHAVLWKDGKIADLGTLGGLESYAAAINSSGQVVGSAYLAKDSEPPHATLWDHGKIIDLNSQIKGQLPPGVIIRQATAISDDGKIQVDGPSADYTQTLYYLLTPVKGSNTKAPKP
jgi:probable HAF family extracellular repeat protein